MKYLLFGLFFSISYPNLFSQTSSDPEKIVKNGLEQRIASESQGALKLINFKKIDGTSSDFIGENIYDLKFQIEIEVVKSYYLNTSLSQPFVGVEGSGWKYFECTTQGEGFLYKVKLTIGQKYSLIGNATLLESTNGYYFSGYEITSHNELSGASNNTPDENKPKFQASSSKEVYCRYEKGNMVGVNEPDKKYVGYWANINNECFSIKYEKGVFNIYMDCSYIPETEATFLTTDVKANIKLGPKISFIIDTLAYTLTYSNECFKMTKTKYEKPNKSINNLLYYDVKLNSNALSRTLFSLKYTDNSYYDESIYPKYKLKNDVLAYIDSSLRFNIFNENNNSTEQIVYNVDFNVVIYALQTKQSLYTGGVKVEIIVKDLNNEIICSSIQKSETGILNDYKTEKDAINAIINKIEKPIYLAIWSCFPINTQIIGIIERDKKGNAKTVKINAGHEMGVFKNCQFRIDDVQIKNTENKNKGQLQVVSVNADGTSICKVIGQSDTITEIIDSGKFIPVTTIYDAVE